MRCEQTVWPRGLWHKRYCKRGAVTRVAGKNLCATHAKAAERRRA